MDNHTAHPTLMLIVLKLIHFSNVGGFILVVLKGISYAEYHHNKQNESILKSTRQMREKHLQICLII